MTVVVPSIVEMSMDKRAFWIGARANDWTAERVIIASNNNNNNNLFPSVH